MADFHFRVDTALSEVPVNILPLLDDTDFKSREVAIAYNAAGMDLVWNFVDHNGNFTQTAVTPTSGGAYDWTHQGKAQYTIEIPASGGASINNDTEGFGWFTGVATGVLPWRGPIVQFVPDALADIEDGSASVGTAQTGDVYAALTAAQSEPGQEAPAANASILTKIAYLFKAWRNKKTFDGTTEKLFNDDAATVDHKRTVSDDGSTLTKNEIAAGP